jgi:hypothetical protein
LNKFAPPKRLQGIEKSVIRQVFDRALPGSLNLGLGEPDLPTPDVIRTLPSGDRRRAERLHVTRWSAGAA